MRETQAVAPLELFFDLVFVLALTQCTALMADTPTWEGLAKGLLVLGVLWWAWVGYAWLTSLVDPEEGVVRLAIFAAMAALLVAALCVPQVFEDTGLLTAASFADGPLQGGLWVLAIALDMGGPYLFGADGWKLMPAHFSERHGLIVIIALGESIVAIGAGVGAEVGAGVVVAAVLGVVVAAGLWWLYFDIVALVAERRLSNAAAGRERNELARDCYSYLHLPMVAGIVLVALGMKKTLGEPGDALKLVPAVALLGGAALYLFAHVAFRWRAIHRLNRQRLACGVILIALVPLAVAVPSIASVAILAALLIGLIVFENHRFAELRDRLRHQVAHENH